MITTLYEPFRHWSEGGSVYILSDLHFSDSDCKVMDPNWITPEEQLDIINGMVGKGDTFVCLGDVGDPKYMPDRCLFQIRSFCHMSLYTDFPGV